MALSKQRNIPLILKLSVMISLLAIGAISIVSIFMLTKQSSLENDQIKDFAKAMALQLATGVNEPLFTDDHLSLQLMINNFSKLPRVAGVIVFNSEHDVLAKVGLPEREREVSRLLDALKTAAVTSSNIHNNGIIAAASSIDFRETIGGYVYIQLQTNTVVQTYTRNLIYVLLVAGIVSIIALIAAYWISRYVSRPISQLLEVTDRIGKGTFHVDVKGFRNDELGKLLAAISEMGQGLFRKVQVESLLNKFLAKNIAEEVMHQLETVNVSGEQVEASVLFVDIVGFTAMSEKKTPEQVAIFLNEYFSYFITCSQFYFGTIDKFIGDCAMVVFGAPKVDADHQFRAIACAVLMQKLIFNINIQRQKEGKEAVYLSIGVNSGKMLAGVLGTHHKMEYTVVGDSVNLASRLCSEAQAGQIITTSDLCSSLLADRKVIAQPYKQLRVRGKDEPIETYIVEGVRREHQLAMDGLIEDVMNTLKVQ